MTAPSKVFFITGVSSGFGKEYVIHALANGHKEYVIHALANGHKVVAAGRTGSKLTFPGATADNFLGVDVDVTSTPSTKAAFKASLDKFGRLDVVCANSGYGLSGEFESLTEEQVQEQFDVNFFGVTKTVRETLPILRQQKPAGGVIQVVTSIGGQIGVPTYTAYTASKWACEGFIESLAKETDQKPEWGIKYTLIEPGGFRTEWAGKNMKFNDQQAKHSEYSHVNSKENASKRHGKQPVKGAIAFYNLALEKEPPLRIILGSDAHAALTNKHKVDSERAKKWEHYTLNTDVDGYKA
ncbi:Predicted dehydrogenase [Ceraceosorus bombacis]|uniref:Predicted dehydrogenase n=1 Tax=Ceraceosorus bombacis TaxID=401625 RepID=A0A0P1BB04_9BASI|nr:Predicted dehydrogenase [Ceraceosorus bombacis]